MTSYTRSTRKPLTAEQRAAKRAYDRERYLRQREERDASRPPDPIDGIDEVTAAYLAGLTDGDGSIYITRTNRLRTYYPAVCWAMTHRPTIDWVGEQLGVTTVVMNNHTNLRRGETSWGKSNFKPQWRVGVSGTRAALICRRMLPYLRTKREQAELVLQFPAEARRGTGVYLSGEVRTRRIELGEAISRLNRA